MNSRPRRDKLEEASSLLTAIDSLPAVQNRLKGVVVRNSDALDVIWQEDSPNTFFYLKPTYLPETCVTPCDDLPKTIREQQRELMELLTTIQGKFLLWGYDSPIYSTFASAHDWRSVHTPYEGGWRSRKYYKQLVAFMWVNY